MATLFTPFFQQVDSNGNPLSGAKLYFYQTGTSTPQDTYTSSSLQTPNVNPVVADSNGRWGSIYLGTSADYKVILKDSSDVTIATVDPVYAAGTSGRAAVNDVAYTASVSDRLIAYTALTSARNVTLPAASDFPAGTLLTLVDEAGGATASVTLSLVPHGTDTINGANSTTAVINTAYGSAQVESNGISKWTVVRGAINKYTVQTFTSGSGTYTTPAGVTRLRVRMVGGGGGGGGVGLSTGPTGGSGGNTTFNSVTANGGAGGAGATGSVAKPTGGAGGTGGSGTASVRIAGATGNVMMSNTGAQIVGAGSGGASPFGGAGAAQAEVGTTGAAGISAVTGSGSGGGGALGTSLATEGGTGGGAGEYVELVIANPAASYSYAVGAAGAGGVGTGTSAFTGGAGGTGTIIVEEFY